MMRTPQQAGRLYRGTLWRLAAATEGPGASEYELGGRRRRPRRLRRYVAAAGLRKFLPVSSAGPCLLSARAPAPAASLAASHPARPALLLMLPVPLLRLLILSLSRLLPFQLFLPASLLDHGTAAACPTVSDLDLLDLPAVDPLRRLRLALRIGCIISAASCIDRPTTIQIPPLFSSSGYVGAAPPPGWI